MNFSINNQQSLMDPRQDERNDNVSFNNEVLKYFKREHPDADLNTLLLQLKSLPHQHPVTMQQLVHAATYANGELRKDKDEQVYLDTVLNKMTTRLLGVNMFFNTTIQNMLYPADEKETW